MIKELTCIECPKGCRIRVEAESGHAKSITGFGCDKGEKYARAETEDPQRILTSAVRSGGLEIKMVPVRTDKPIPRDKLFEAMNLIKNIKVDTAVAPGDILFRDFIKPGVNLISTRKADKL